MERCPAPDTLRRFIEDLLSEGEAATVSDHVDTCTLCQERLGTLYEPSRDDALPRIPGYQVLEQLGEGGMGIVYRAVDHRRGQAVALKVMKWVDPSALYRFKREFRALALLHHRNLVTLFELVAAGPRWFFTMELLEGVDFLVHVRGQPAAGLSTTESYPSAARLGSGRRPGEPTRSAGPARVDCLRDALRQLADGVAFLHAAGKLHRDIKPRNVLVTPQGRVALLDFGLVADLGRTGKYHSADPRLLGTIPYMAPEQAACREVTPASDWYAVGAMLYEALTGRLPFDGPALEILTRKQHEDPPHPGEHVPDVPGDLAALCLDLLRCEPQARPTGEEVMRRLADGRSADSVPPPPPRLEVPLVGRRRHLEHLDRAFADLGRRQPVVVAVHGRSGVGKSALLDHFLANLAGDGLAESRAVVLAGRCYEQESVPYKALDSLIDALSNYLAGLRLLEVQALLPRDVAALVQVFPVLGRVEAVADAPRRGSEVAAPRELRRRALTALRELLARLGDRRPLVLAIDDLQWGDADSAALLAGLLQPPDPPVLLLVGSYRSEAPGDSSCVAALRRLLAQGGGAAERDLMVEPLGPAEQRELARALLPADDQAAEAHADLIARQSGGFPFFVHELVQHLRSGHPPASGDPGPETDLTLHEVLWGRVRRLGEAARVVLEVVAVAGQPLPWEHACRAAGLPAEQRLALAELRAARFLRGDAPGCRPQVETYHDRIRETVVDRLDPEVRRRHHRRLAEVLDHDATSDPEVVAIHFHGGGELARAGQYYARAAGQAAGALAFDRAAKLYRQALQLLAPSGPEARGLRTRLGDALAAGGRGAEAAREYLTATAGAPGAEALDLQRRAALQLLRSGHIDEGLSALRTVLAAVGLRFPGSPRRAFWSLVGLRVWLRLRGLGVRRREANPADLTAQDACHAAAIGLGMVDPIQGAYFQSRGLLRALRAGEPGRLAVALALEAAHESIGGTWNRRRTETLLRAAEQAAREVGQPYHLALTALARGMADAHAGDWPAARTLCDQAEATFRKACTGVMWELGLAHRYALWPLIFMGELAEVARRLPALLQDARDRDDLFEVTNLQLGVATVVGLAANQPSQARARLAEAMARWSPEGFHVQHMNRLYDDTQIDLYEGQGLAAWQRLTAHWDLLERSHLLRVQQVRIFLVHARARSALAAAAQVAAPGPFLAAAAGDARTLWRERAAWAQALAQLIHAGLAMARGDGPGAAGLLRDAIARCDGAALGLYAAAARRRLGGLLGDEEGRRLVAQADAWMAGQYVVRPRRMTALLVPGLGNAEPNEEPPGNPRNCREDES